MYCNPVCSPARNIQAQSIVYCRKPGLSLLCLTLLLLFCHTARANANSADQYRQLHTYVAEQEVGYRTTIHHELRQRAKQALTENEPYLANRLWEILARQGDRDAAFRLGLYFDVGNDGQRDIKRALYWYRRAAEAGEVHAQHNLGVAYANGDGVAIDINMAIKWWTIAARRGNADSQYNLGIMYAMGVGIKKDLEEAKRWWRKAAIHGDPMAQYNLGTLYVNGGVLSYCEATRWWEKSAKNGISQASHALAVIKTRQDYLSCW
jgi:TPR repeat protein